MVGGREYKKMKFSWREWMSSAIRHGALGLMKDGKYYITSRLEEEMIKTVF